MKLVVSVVLVCALLVAASNALDENRRSKHITVGGASTKGDQEAPKKGDQRGGGTTTKGDQEAPKEGDQRGGGTTQLPQSCYVPYNQGETCTPSNPEAGQQKSAKRMCEMKDTDDLALQISRIDHEIQMLTREGAGDGKLLPLRQHKAKLEMERQHRAAQIDFGKSETVGGCVGDCSCACATCVRIDPVSGLPKFELDFSGVSCGCLSCCFGDYACGEPSVQSLVHSSHETQMCTSNTVSSEEDLNADGDYEETGHYHFAYPTMCYCAFSKAYTDGNGGVDKPRVIQDWARANVGSEKFTTQCPSSGLGVFVCAKNKFLIDCQQTLMGAVLAKQNICGTHVEPKAPSLLQNLTSTNTDRMEGADLILSLIAESQNSDSKAGTGWNCG